MTISRKIFTLAIVFAFLVIAVGGYAMSHMARIGHDVHAVSQPSITLTEASWTLHRIATGQLRQLIQFERALAAATGRGHGDAHEARYREARSEFERLDSELLGAIEQGEARVQTVLLRAMDARSRTKLEALGARLLEAATGQRVFAEQARGIFASIDEGAVSRAVEDAARVGAGAVSFDFELARLISDVRARTGESIASSQRAQGAARAGLILLVCFVSLLGPIAWALMARSIVTPLAEIGRIAEAVAEGRRDLALPRAREDEAGRVLNAFRQLMSSVEVAEDEVRRKARSLDGALARIGDQNRRLHALELELARAHAAAAPPTGSGAGREIVGPQRRSDT